MQLDIQHCIKTMSIIYGTKINQLLANTSPTGLLFADWMKKEGYSGQLQKRYRDSGWLTAMCKGVMYRTGSRLSAYDAIASYTNIYPLSISQVS